MAPSSLSISGSGVVLTLATAVAAGQSVTLTYTIGSNPIQDASGTSAAGFTDTSVTNTTPAVSPTAPQNLAVSAASQGATFTWEAPANDGGASITRYEYRYKTTGSYPATWTTVPDGDDVDTNTGNETTLMVTGLTSDVLHAFQFRAVNSAGGSVPVSIEVTPCILGGDGMF